MISIAWEFWGEQGKSYGELVYYWRQQLMEWGLLPLDVATEVFAKKQGLKLRSPVKTPSTQRRASSLTKKILLLGDKKTNSGTKGKTTAQKKRASSDIDDDEDDDFVKTNSATKGKTTTQKRKKASSNTDDDDDDGDFVMPKKPKKQ